MLDETLPLTVNEFEEWGNPKKAPDFNYMMQYSPYDNVAKQAYPAMLVRTSYNDSQVMYWEPAKWVAKLRATKTSDRPLLFKIAMDPAGHGGQSGRYQGNRPEVGAWRGDDSGRIVRAARCGSRPPSRSRHVAAARRGASADTRA